MTKSWYKDEGSARRCTVVLDGSFAVATGGGAVTLGSFPGAYSVTREATGKYRIRFNDSYKALAGFALNLEYTGADGYFMYLDSDAHVGGYADVYDHDGYAVIVCVAEGGSDADPLGATVWASFRLRSDV